MKLSRGVLFMAASAFGFSCMSVLVKLTSARLPIGEIVFARALVSLVMSFAMARRAGVAPFGNRPARLALRGLLGFGALTGQYVALAHLPLADATTLQNAAPLITAVLAWWLLDERVGWSTAFAIVCGMIGVLLIVHPQRAGLDRVGVAAALVGVVSSSIAFVTIRKLVRTEHPLVIVLYFPLIAAPLSLPWMLTSFVMPGAVDVAVLVAIGIVTQTAQICLTHGLALERAGKATSVAYLQVALAMVWQLLVFGDMPAGWTLAGAGLIVGSTLGVAQLGAARVRRAPAST